MPTYVYKFIDTDETIEVQQSFTDDTLTEYAHPSSGELMAVKKVFQPVGVTFKGSGFFKTDHRGAPSSTTPSGDSPSSTTKTTDSSSGDAGSSGSSSGSSPKSPASSSSTKPAKSPAPASD